MIEHHAPARFERARHGVGVDRFHADHLDRRTQALDVGGDARDQPPAAHRDEHRVQGLSCLAHDFHPDRALARDDIGIVVGVDERELARALEAPRLRISLVVGVAVQVDFRPARLDRVHLDLGRSGRHHDHRRAAELLRGERHSLSVIAGRGGDDPAGERPRGQIRHFVVGAAALEGEHRLHVLALE